MEPLLENKNAKGSVERNQTQREGRWQNRRRNVLIYLGMTNAAETQVSCTRELETVTLPAPYSKDAGWVRFFCLPIVEEKRAEKEKLFCERSTG